MTGAAFVLLWGALDFVWSDDDPHLEKALSLSAGMLRFPVQQLVLVNTILLFVRFLRCFPFAPNDAFSWMFRTLRHASARRPV